MPEPENTTSESPDEMDQTESEQTDVTAFTPFTEEQILSIHLGKPVPQFVPILIVDYDPEWPRLYEREAVRIQSALGNRALLLEHVGSTSVPGLAAKPRIDILLVVADSSDESDYIPALEAASYELHIREPGWYEHRLLKGPDTAINLHVFSPGCPEIDRMLLFRNWLRINASDRQLYEHTKRQLARLDWKYTQNYADAKAAVVEEILARALEGAGEGARDGE